MSEQPDIAGWLDAQDRMRVSTGQDVTFKLRNPPVYAAGVQLDPESGQPFDPTIDPISGGDLTDVVKRVGVIFRPVRGNVKDDESDEAGGAFLSSNVALDVAVADHAAIQDAVQFVLNGRDYRITDILPDGLTQVDRYLAFGQVL